jgi:phage replication O-like protein O
MTDNVSEKFMKIPNVLVDDYMQRLSANAFRIYMVLVRKTKGWKKDYDSLSQSQIKALTGIRSDKTVRKALDELIAFKIISEHKKTGCQSTFFVSLFVEETTPVKNTEAKEIEVAKDHRKNYDGTVVKNTEDTPVNFTNTKDNSINTNKINIKTSLMDQSLSFSKLKFKELTGRDPAISKKVIRNLEETMSHKQIYSFESFEIWITSYFAKIKKSKWLTGDEFQLHLSWVLDLANVIKIESGAYDNFRKKSSSIDACGYIAQKKGTANYDDDQDPRLQDPWDNL